MFLLVLPLATLASAAPVPVPKFEAQPFDWAPRSEAVCAGSGLRVSVERDAAAGRVAVVAVVDGGSADDPPGQEGLAHLVEHLWFRSRGGDASVMETLSVLGEFNAFTEPDVTVYISSVLPSDLDRVLALEGRRFTDPLAGVDEAVVAAEREVVGRELNGQVRDGAGQAMELIDRQLFPSPHPYARIGTRNAEVARTLTLAQVKAFVERHYLPGNTTLHLAGAVPDSDLTARLVRDFPEAALRGPPGPAPRCPANTAWIGDPPALQPAAETTVHLPVREALDVVAFSVPGGWTDTGGVEATADIYLGEALGMGCFRLTHRLASEVVCSAVRGPAAPPGLRDLRGLNKFTASSFVVGKLLAWDRAGPFLRPYIRTLASTWLAPFSPQAVAPYLANHDTRSGGWYAAQFARLVRADPREPFAYAAQWFSPQRAVRLTVLPDPASADVPALAHASLPALDAAIEVDPARLAARLPDLAHVTVRERLANGATVAVLPHGTFPEVAVELFFGGAADREPVRGLYDVTGSQERWLPLNVDWEFLVWQVRSGILLFRADANDAHSFRASGPPGALPEILWMLRQRILGVQYEDRAADAAEVLAQRLRTELLDPATSARRLAMERLFGAEEEPAQRTWQKAQLLGPTKRAGFLRGLRQPSISTLAMVGALDPATAIAAAHVAFDDWPVPAAEIPALNGRSLQPDPTAAEAGAFVSLAGTGSASLAFACPIGDADPAAVAAVEAGVSSAVWTAVRDRAGAAYDPWVEVVRRADTGPVLQLGASVAPERAGEAVTLLRGVIQALATQADDAQARRMVLSAATRLDLARSSNSGLLSVFEAASHDVEPATFFARERAGLLALDGGAVRARFTKCAANLSWAAAGHPSTVAALSAAKLSSRSYTETEWVAAHVFDAAPTRR